MCNTQEVVNAQGVMLQRNEVRMNRTRVSGWWWWAAARDQNTCSSVRTVLLVAWKKQERRSKHLLFLLVYEVEQWVRRTCQQLPNH